ncbi:hypothetical protein N7474_007841 [Penicillium riverlandense]|uniref:uncharacterized protein n=1 Tax=Penicillium riverlandense TaxID=1903569 RepID=UPI0025474CAD|nr:uncharacterized protein N7474_007841 [Penicillium riverlandense]KAJ5811540.1 hypothetical protein N7474_007841 [Penicillium riverlandense]
MPPNMNGISLINPSSLLDPTQHLYSHVSVIENPARLIRVAGQVGIDREGKTPTYFEAQTRLALSNAHECLKAAGATIRNITYMTIYVADYNPEVPIWGAIQEFLTDKDGIHLPPAALIPVPMLGSPEWKVEVIVEAATSKH